MYSKVDLILVLSLKEFLTQKCLDGLDIFAKATWQTEAKLIIWSICDEKTLKSSAFCNKKKGTKKKENGLSK